MLINTYELYINGIFCFRAFAFPVSQDTCIYGFVLDFYRYQHSWFSFILYILWMLVRTSFWLSLQIVVTLQRHKRQKKLFLVLHEELKVLLNVFPLPPVLLIMSFVFLLMWICCHCSIWSGWLWTLPQT